MFGFQTKVSPTGSLSSASSYIKMLWGSFSKNEWVERTKRFKDYELNFLWIIIDDLLAKKELQFVWLLHSEDAREIYLFQKNLKKRKNATVFSLKPNWLFYCTVCFMLWRQEQKHHIHNRFCQACCMQFIVWHAGLPENLRQENILQNDENTRDFEQYLNSSTMINHWLYKTFEQQQ